jgi:hypothetical protein
MAHAKQLYWVDQKRVAEMEMGQKEPHEQQY